MRSAFQSAAPALLKDVQEYLLALDSAHRRVRHCALQYMNKLYPFHDVRARFFCLLLSQDSEVSFLFSIHVTTQCDFHFQTHF